MCDRNRFVELAIRQPRDTEANSRRDRDLMMKGMKGGARGGKGAGGRGRGQPGQHGDLRGGRPEGQSAHAAALGTNRGRKSNAKHDLDEEGEDAEDDGQSLDGRAGTKGSRGGKGRDDFDDAGRRKGRGSRNDVRQQAGRGARMNRGDSPRRGGRDGVYGYQGNRLELEANLRRTQLADDER